MKTLRAGSSEVCITPQCKVSLAGYFNDRVADGVLDDIYVKSLVLESEGERAVLFVFDLAYVEYEFVQKVRRTLSVEHGLREDMAMFTAVETHTAPEVRADGHVPVSSLYLEFLYEKTLEAFLEAQKKLRLSKVRFCLGRNSELAFNRRYWMKSGNVITNPGKLNPDIMRPEGPIDPDVGVAAFFAGGQLSTVLVNISNHCDTVGGTYVSADWPGYLSRLVKEKLGKDVSVLVIVGAAGNINHIDVTTDRNQTCYEELRRTGGGYAKTILDSLAKCKPVTYVPLRLARTSFDVHPREISEQEIRQAHKDATLKTEVTLGDWTSEGLAGRDPTIMKYFAMQLLMVAQDRSPRRLEVQGIRFGDLVILSLPGEPFVEIGRELKEYSSARYTFIAGHGNVACGYIPLEKNFPRGGYETTPLSSPNSIKTAAILTQKAKKLLDELFRSIEDISEVF